ncbi:MAG: hypothetical protein U9Q81_01860 [Pseudomonadota bacterium]|nr:hypothetical protein [Pseudomonadota bacterium]
MKSFASQFDGPLTGLLQWSQWDALTGRLSAGNDGGWFVYFVGENLPTEPMSPDAFGRFLNEIDRLLRNDHRESYPGIVYVDDPSAPSFVKIYDPNNLGASCGSSEVRVLPGWVVSRTPPAPLAAPVRNPAGRRRWWQALLRNERTLAA